MFFDPMYFIVVGPAFLLALLASLWVKSAFASGMNVPTGMSGAEAARRILQMNGLNLPIEEIPGDLSDHYDPTARVLRLSSAVYHGRTAAAVGVAAHECGHALQHAEHYMPLVVRNLAVPMASFGSGAGIWMFLLGMIFNLGALTWAGIIVFSGVVFFQVVNLPVELNASSRARYILANMGTFDETSLRTVSRVLTAAAMTYVAATLQAILTLIYLILRSNRE
ncbi:MAG: zinc metallopeptidase [Planctomycetia bacterium]|nr:zinc metallopeptidase [Planctomycetia bacterium]